MPSSGAERECVGRTAVGDGGLRKEDARNYRSATWGQGMAVLREMGAMYVACDGLGRPEGKMSSYRGRDQSHVSCERRGGLVDHEL